MPELARPLVDVQTSFLDAMAELRAEGRGRSDDASMIGWEMREFGNTWGTPEGFAEYVAALRFEEREALRTDWVPCSTLWYIEGNEYLGRLAIRHRLTENLLESGGHIGYDVRPTARRRGHATAMLREALPFARSLGIDEVLVTCDDDNVGSRRVIENNGGRFEDQRGRKLRYWISTA